MAQADRGFDNSGLAGPGLLYVPAPSDMEDQESGIAQFGQLHPGPVDPTALRIKKESQTDGYNSIDQAADRFAVLTHLVDTVKAYQILPVDVHRKRASIIVASAQPNVAAPPTAQQTATPGNPAAGANFNTVLNGTYRATIAAVQFTLTTSATVANRTAGITYDGMTFNAGVAQTAGLVETYSFYPGAALTTVLPATGGQLTVPIPAGLSLNPGAAIASAIGGIQAGDQISAITIIYTLSSNTAAVANGVVVGEQAQIDSVAAALVAGNPLPAVGFPIYAANQSPFIYTNKSPLYACSLVAGVGIVLNTMVERFNAGVNVGS